LAGSSNTPFPKLNQAVAQALDKTGLKIVLVQPQSDTSGPTGSFTAGALVIKYKDDGDHVVPAQVGGLHNDFTIALGGAAASVGSSEASNVDLGTGVGQPDTGTPPEATQVLAAGETTPPAVGVEVATPPAGLAASPPGTRLAAGLPIARLGGFAGLAWSLVLFAVLAALGIGFGLRRVTDEVLTDAPTGASC